MKGNGIRRWKRYSEHQDSGVELLGELPKHWEVKRLKFLADFVGGGTPSKDNLDFWNGNVPWVSPKDMKARVIKDTEDHITEDAVRNSSTRMVPAQSILIVVRSGILKHSIPVAINLCPVTLNQDMKAILPKSGTLPEYIAYFIEGRQKELLVEWHKQGATVDSLEFELIANTPFPVPVNQEQGVITAFLNRETAKLDTLVAKKERLIELLQEKRAAIIARAVTKGLDPNVPMKDSEVEWLGRVPAHWRLKRVKHLVRTVGGIQMGPFGGMLKALQAQPTLYKLYGQENTINNDFTAGRRWLSESHFRQLREYELRPGDVVLTRKGASIGNCRIVPPGIECGVIDSDTIRVRVNESIDVDFIVLLMHEGYLETEILAKQKGSVLPGLNTGTIANLRVAVPPVHEQQAILAHVTEQRNRLDSLASRVREAIDRLREYRTALISAAVTGKIDLRDEA